jgi:hypothetical protein
MAGRIKNDTGGFIENHLGGYILNDGDRELVALSKVSAVGSASAVTVNTSAPGAPAVFQDLTFSAANPSSIRSTAFAPVGFAMPWTAGALTTSEERTCTMSSGEELPCWLGPTYGKDDSFRWCQILGLDLAAGAWVLGTISDAAPSSPSSPPSTLQDGLAAFSFPSFTRGGETIQPVNYALEASISGVGRMVYRGYGRFTDDFLIVIRLYFYAAPMPIGTQRVLSQVGFEVQAIASDRTIDHYQINMTADLVMEIDEAWDIHVDWLAKRGGQLLSPTSGKTRVKLFDSEDVSYLAQGQGPPWSGAFFEASARCCTRPTSGRTRSRRRGRRRRGTSLSPRCQA